MNKARTAGPSRIYRLPCGEPLTSPLRLPDEPRAGGCADRQGPAACRDESICPGNAFSAVTAPPGSTGADRLMDSLCLDHVTAASLDWALTQYCRLLDAWFSAPSYWSPLGLCQVPGRGDSHERRGERRR